MNNLQISLSSTEMVEVSNDISKKFSPLKPIKMPGLGKDIELSSKELLEVSQNINLYFAPTISSSSQKLVLLPIDPQHLYVYWSLGDNQTNKISQTLIKGQLALRIYAKSDEKQEAVKVSPIAEIAIHDVQARQRIKLPTALNGANGYSARIGEYDSDNAFVSLLESKITPAFQGGDECNNKSKVVSSLMQSPIEVMEIHDGLTNQLRLSTKVSLDNRSLSIHSHYASSNRSGQNNR